jgi:hypothetical protein
MANRTSIIGMAIFAAAGLLMTVSLALAAGQAVNAKTVAEHMDKSKYSSSEIKSYLKGLKGETITADGKIHDILTGKTGTRVVLSVNAGRSNDFVVDVYVDDASKLHKDEHVSCKGEYAKYNMFTVNGIALKGGSCSKK